MFKWVSCWMRRKLACSCVSCRHQTYMFLRHANTQHTHTQHNTHTLRNMYGSMLRAHVAQPVHLHATTSPRITTVRRLQTSSSSPVLAQVHIMALPSFSSCKTSFPVYMRWFSTLCASLCVCSSVCWFLELPLLLLVADVDVAPDIVANAVGTASAQHVVDIVCGIRHINGEPLCKEKHHNSRVFVWVCDVFMR